MSWLRSPEDGFLPLGLLGLAAGGGGGLGGAGGAYHSSWAASRLAVSGRWLPSWQRAAGSSGSLRWVMVAVGQLGVLVVLNHTAGDAPG